MEYKEFPIKEVSKFAKGNTLNRISKLIINGVSIEPMVASKLIITKYKELGKMIQPNYFNPTLTAFKKEIKKASTLDDYRAVFNTYSSQLDAEFNQMKMDMKFCKDGYIQLNKKVSLSPDIKITELEDGKD